MMQQVMTYMNKDISMFMYLLKNENYLSFQQFRLGCIALMILVGLTLSFIGEWSWQGTFIFLVFCFIIGYKIPWVWLKLKHTQQCNHISDAIIIWVNTLYSLIGENNIYNAIALSMESSPKILHKDLDVFIQRITKDHGDKEAYLDFLSVYQIDGFQDIMMKLFEYRELSKDKLKYEIAGLTKVLSKIEQSKRERRYRSELFTADLLTMVMMSIPCMYMFFVSLILSQLLMS